MRLMNNGKTLFESFQENLKEATFDESWCQEQAEYYFNLYCQDTGAMGDDSDWEDIISDYTDNKADIDRTAQLIRDAWNMVKDHIYHYDYKAYLELSDTHTLWQIDNDKFPSDDYAATEYNDLVENAVDAFKSATGVDLLLLGRSGRHACVELNYANTLRYSELVGKQKELEQQVIDAMNNWEPEVEESVEPEKEQIKEQDTVVQVNIPTVDDRDYTITDITELRQVADGDVQSPIDITGLLNEVDIRLSESLGENWGTINYQSTRFNKDTGDSNALFELCISGQRGYGKTYLMSMLLEENGSLVKVNNTKGQTIFKRRTSNPVSIVESYIKQFLPKEEVPEILKNMNERLDSIYNYIKVQIDVLNDAPNEGKDDIKKCIQDQIYSFVAELSDEVHPEEPTDEDSLDLHSFDKMIEEIFGKDFIRTEEQEQIEVAGTETLKESAFYYKMFNDCNEIDYVEFNSKQEAEEYAKKKNEETGHETAVYDAENNECLASYDAKDKIKESDETTEGEQVPEDSDNTTEEPKNGLGTGYAVFVRKPENLDDLNNKSKTFTSGKSEYLICEDIKLSEEEFDEICDSMISPNKYCKEFKPLDVENYAFNCIKFTCDGKDFSLLVDPSGFDYCRYVAKVEK